MKPIKWEQAYNGKWMRPRMRGYYVACCGCGLVHVKSFRVRLDPKHGHPVVEYKASVDKKQTRARRRKTGQRVVSVKPSGSAGKRTARSADAIRIGKGGES